MCLLCRTAWKLHLSSLFFFFCQAHLFLTFEKSFSLCSFNHMINFILQWRFHLFHLIFNLVGDSIVYACDCRQWRQLDHIDSAFIYLDLSCKISCWHIFGGHLLQTDDLQNHIIICGFGRVGQVSSLFFVLINYS